MLCSLIQAFSHISDANYILINDYSFSLYSFYIYLKDTIQFIKNISKALSSFYSILFKFFFIISSYLLKTRINNMYRKLLAISRNSKVRGS